MPTAPAAAKAPPRFPAPTGDVVVDETPVAVDAAPDPGLPAETIVADRPAANDRLVSEVVPTDDSQQTLGVTWSAASASDELGVEVRTRTDGEWSRWVPLEDDGVAPDTGTTEAGRDVRPGTESVWIGGADAVQLSFLRAVSDSATDIRLALLGSEATADVATDDGVVRDSAKASRAEAARTDATTAAANVVPTGAVSPPAIIQRWAWGAAAATCTLDVASTLKAAVVHHTAGPNDYATVEAAAAQIRNDQRYHQESRGWCDIGYNFLVDKWGNVYEGRADSLTKPVIGVHAGGFNTATVGISMLGDYTSITPAASVRESIAQLIAARMSAYHRDPASTISYTTLGGDNSKYAAGTTLALPVVLGHRDVAYTACPGESAYPQLGSIRTRARELIGATFVNPTPSSTSLASGAGLTIFGGVNGNIDWTLSVVDQSTGIEISRTTGALGPSTGGTLVAWNGRSTSGSVVGAGTYRLGLSGTDHWSGVPVVPFVQSFTVSAGQNPPVVSPVPVVGNTRFVPVTPGRLLDTRLTGSSLGPGGRIDVRAAGLLGVPDDAKGVALNVTTVASSATTFLRVWPAGQSMPDASVVNTDSRRTTGAGVIAGVGGEGKVSIYNNAGTTHVVVDVSGYFVDDTAASGYSPLPAGTRVLDSRTGGQRLVAGATRTVQVAGVAGIPSDATAVLANVSSVLPAGPGNIIAYPAGGAVPTVASVNHLPNNSVSNRTIVPLGAGGKVSLTLQGWTADVVLDVVGWFGPTGQYEYTPIVPARAWDTRTSGGQLGAGQSRDLSLAVAALPSDAKVAVVAMAATRQTAAATFLTMWPPTLSRPTASDLNTGAGRDQSSLAAVPIGTDRMVRVYNDAGSTDVVLDVQGWFG
ncbi:hypothetical protein ASE38_11100 [Cellulomonas sp. Root930]|nr:hypothetical protein ASE38_11100 [Cellulomonas sp. Root930]